MVKDKTILLGVLFGIMMCGCVSSSCFDENTTVEDVEIGVQGIDIIGCKLVEMQGNSGYYVVFAIFISICFGAIIFFVVMSGLVSLLLGGRGR